MAVNWICAKTLFIFSIPFYAVYAIKNNAIKMGIFFIKLWCILNENNLRPLE